MPRSPLTEIISKVSALAEQIHALPEDERNYLLDLLLPEEPVKPTKKRKVTSVKPRVYDHCAQCDKTKGHSFHKDSAADGYHEFRSSKPKSARAASLARHIMTAGLPKPGNEKEPICAACGNVEDYADHSQPSPHYHPFASSSTAAAAGCIHEQADGKVCGQPASDHIHDPVCDHIFAHAYIAPPGKSSSSARSAAGRSSSKSGSPTGSGASSKIDADAASVVAGG